MNLKQRTEALLALVEQYRAARCAQLLAPAQAQADAIERGARAEARRRVHTTVTEERQRFAREVTAAQAQLATERRAFAQRRAKLLLDAGWVALRSALKTRWSDPAARSRWIASHLRRALSALPHGGDVPWRIHVPAGLPNDERTALLATLSESGVTRATCCDDASIDAGLRVEAGANVLDASLDGLLADRAALEGRLLQAVAPEAHAPDEELAPATEST